MSGIGTKPDDLEVQEVIGRGSFGVVRKGVLRETDRVVAVKRLEGAKLACREIEVLRIISCHSHPNVVEFIGAFDESTDEKSVVCVLFGYISHDLARIIAHYAKTQRVIPAMYQKLYMFQLARAMLYIHALDVCHRDIKPANVLVDLSTHQLRLCDFGSAKCIKEGGPNITYITSRFYRAPELIFDSTCYSQSVDIWSYGCVLAEVLCGEAIFKGSCSTEQFIEIVSILGSPTAAELKQLNPRMAAVDYSVIEPYPLHKVLGPDVSVSGTRLLERLIQYTPSRRLRPEHIITDPFFQALRNPGLKLQDDRDLPPLWNMTPPETQQMLMSPASRSADLKGPAG